MSAKVEEAEMIWVAASGSSEATLLGRLFQICGATAKGVIPPVVERSKVFTERHEWHGRVAYDVAVQCRVKL